MDILIKNVRAVDPQNKLDEITDIAIADGKIVSIGKTDETAERVIDAQGKLTALPGLFDMHVHFRDPGQTHKEDIFTGAAAAKAGGFTGVACMPNTKPVIDNAELVKYVLNKAQKTGIDVLPIGCVTKGMQSKELCDYDELKAAGVCALSDDGRPVENAELMRQALEKSLENGLTVLSHCEDLNIINGGIINKGEISAKLGVKGMDRASEDSVTAREIALAMSCGAHIHICHVSTRGSVNIIRAAKKDGVNVTCETGPHYFTFTDEKLLSRDADYRMSPPLRTEDDRQAVEEAVLDGTIDCIITDHAPHSAQEKADFETAPNGVVGLETSLAATLTKLYHTGKCGLDKIAELMSIRPRQILGLPTAKIAVGERADLAIIDTDCEWEVIPEQLHSKSKNSVFKGERLKGKNLYTICNGKIVYEPVRVSIRQGKWESVTHNATDVRLYSADSEKIFLEFKPARMPDDGNMQWEDWNCYDSVFVYKTDYDRLLVPTLKKLFPLEDPDPNGWGKQEYFDVCSPNWLGADSWKEFITLLEQLIPALTAEEQMFIRTLLPMFKGFLDISSIICVEGNQ